MGVSSKIGTLAMAAQTAKGTPALTPTTKWQLAGSPSIAPIKDRARFAMTDAGRDQGLSYTSQMRVEGDFPVYLHPDGFADIAFGVLGAHSATGVAPAVIDTATPANDVPWWTIWRMVGGNLFEQFVDCKITGLAVEGTAGNPPIATVSVIGRDSIFMSSDTVLAALASRPYVFYESCGKILIDTVSMEIARVTFGVDNNGSGYQADCINLADVDVGARDVTLSFLTRYKDPATEPSYAETYYGSKTPPASTHLTPSTVPKHFVWELYRDADTGIKFDFPQVVYSAEEVQPDPGGDPIELDIACDVEKPAAAPIITITTKWKTGP